MVRLLLLLPPAASPDDRLAFTRAAGWLGEAIVRQSLSDSPSDIFTEAGSTYRVSD
jgi:hypothetical protein